LLAFIGGSVGNVDTVTVDFNGGSSPSSTIPIPKSPGAITLAAVPTEGVESFTLISKNNEGTLASICPSDGSSAGTE